MLQWLIILSKDNTPQGVPYFCMRCRSRLFHVNREAIAIFQGEGYPESDIPRNMGFVEKKCHGCETKYTFYFQ